MMTFVEKARGLEIQCWDDYEEGFFHFGYDFMSTVKWLFTFKLLQHSPTILFEVPSAQMGVLDETLTVPWSPQLEK